MLTDWWGTHLSRAHTTRANTRMCVGGGLFTSFPSFSYYACYYTTSVAIITIMPIPLQLTSLNTHHFKSIDIG